VSYPSYIGTWERPPSVHHNEQVRCFLLECRRRISCWPGKRWTPRTFP